MNPSSVDIVNTEKPILSLESCLTLGEEMAETFLSSGFSIGIQIHVGCFDSFLSDLLGAVRN